MAADHHAELDGWPAVRLVGMAARLDERRINRTITHLGLTKGALEALETIAELHTAKASELAALLCVSAQSMGKVVRRLEGLGLVTKRRGIDGRTASIELTQHGVDVMAAAADLLQRLAQPRTDTDPAFRSHLAYRVDELRSLETKRAPPTQPAGIRGAAGGSENDHWPEFRLLWQSQPSD
jgi:DNA-binding MarR family transcriptional regulator